VSSVSAVGSLCKRWQHLDQSERLLMVMETFGQP